MYAATDPAMAPAPTARAQLMRRTTAASTPSTCGWVTDISVAGGNGELVGYMPLTCAPGLICGSLGGVRGCCSDVAACAGQLALTCFDSSNIVTASPTTGPVLYCSDPVRPSCITFEYNDNFYNSFACGPSELYDMGTYFEALPGSLPPSTALDQSDVVTTFTSFITGASAVAVATGTGTGLPTPPSSSSFRLPIYAIVLIILAGLVILGGIIASSRKRASSPKRDEGAGVVITQWVPIHRVVRW